MKTILERWKRRFLTPIGKITVIKTLIISLLNHIFIGLPNPPLSMLEEINKILFNFIWNGKSRVKNNVITKPYKEGGLKMMNKNALISSLKLSWIKKYILTNGKWKDIASLYIDNNKIMKCGKHYSETPIKNQFWRDTLNAYIQLCNIHTINENDARQYPIFKNRETLI